MSQILTQIVQPKTKKEEKRKEKGGEMRYKKKGRKDFVDGPWKKSYDFGLGGVFAFCIRSGGHSLFAPSITLLLLEKGFRKSVFFPKASHGFVKLGKTGWVLIII